MAFMKDILTRNIPIWEECAATPFVQEVQTGKLPLEKFKRYMIQDSIYLKNYARIYGKAIFHADTLREIQLYYSMLNFVNEIKSAKAARMLAGGIYDKYSADQRTEIERIADIYLLDFRQAPIPHKEV